MNVFVFQTLKKVWMQIKPKSSSQNSIQILLSDLTSKTMRPEFSVISLFITIHVLRTDRQTDNVLRHQTYAVNTNYQCTTLVSIVDIYMYIRYIKYKYCDKELLDTHIWTDYS